MAAEVRFLLSVFIISVFDLRFQHFSFSACQRLTLSFTGQHFSASSLFP